MLNATLVSVNGEIARLSLEDGQVLNVPISAVEGSVKVGQRAALLVVPLGGEDAGKTSIARALLNELLTK